MSYQLRVTCEGTQTTPLGNERGAAVAAFDLLQSEMMLDGYTLRGTRNELTATHRSGRRVVLALVNQPDGEWVATVSAEGYDERSAQQRDPARDGETCGFAPAPARMAFGGRPGQPTENLSTQTHTTEEQV